MRGAPAGVLIVGSVNVDLVVRVERLPVAGETVTGGVFARHHGGKGANQAVAAARLGADVRLVGAVGDDEDGRSAVADLRSEGIDVGAIAIDAGAHTGVALIVVDALGENQIAVASGVNARLNRASVDSHLAGLVPASGDVFLANLEIPDEALLAGAQFAARHGMRLVINPAPARPLPAELLRLRPLLLPNAGEATRLSGRSDRTAAAARLAEMTGEPVVVTLGADGALVHESGRPTVVPATSVKAVDTTGAGDTFAGAFAAELAAGASVMGAARFATAAAAVSVTREGARDGMPRRAQVEALLG